MTSAYEAISMALKLFFAPAHLRDRTHSSHIKISKGGWRKIVSGKTGIKLPGNLMHCKTQSNLGPGNVWEYVLTL